MWMLYIIAATLFIIAESFYNSAGNRRKLESPTPPQQAAPVLGEASRSPIHGSVCCLSMSASSDESNSVGKNPYYSGQDAYQILGISKLATKKEVKTAYRKLVSQWHPDKFPDDEAKKREGGLRMEKINRAYFCLEDDDRRRRYDAYGEKAVGTSASSEKKMKDNADAYFGDDIKNTSDKNNRRYSSGGASSASSATESYRVEDDPFVWEKFRREQEEKRNKYRKGEQWERDNGGHPQPERQRSSDNTGQEWEDDWWRADNAGSGGPRRVAWGSGGSYSNFDEYDEPTEDSVPFPSSESSYEEILEFLQKTGGLGTPPGMDGAGGGSGTTTPPGRIYGDDPSVTSPRLVALRAQKTSLLQEQRALRLRLEEDGRDWGEVSDATAIAKRLADMDRVRSIDNDIVEVDDEIEDAVMRAREGGMETEGGFNQRAWGSAVGSPYDPSNRPPSGTPSERGSGARGGSSPWDVDGDGPRQPRGVMARRRVSGGPGNVFGRPPPSRPPPPPPTSHTANKGNGGDGDDDRQKPTMTSQARAAAEERKARTSSSRSKQSGRTQRKAKDLYEAGDLDVDGPDGDGFDSLLGGKDEGGKGGGVDSRREPRARTSSPPEEGATWRKEYGERRGGRAGRSADEKFIEEIERLSRNGGENRSGKGPRKR